MNEMQNKSSEIIHNTRDVNINLSVQQWEIFNIKGAGLVAHNLNRAVEKAVRDNPNSRNDAFEQAYKTFEKNSKFGARDSEPIWKLERVLDRIYNN